MIERATEHDVRAVAEYLSRVKGTAARLEQGRYWIRCIAPDHADSTPSLDLKLGDKGMVVGYCHGCKRNLDDLLKAAGITWAEALGTPHARAHEAVKQNSAEPDESAQSTPRRIVKTYAYTDAAGALLYEVARFDPKDFRQRRPDGQGGWIWNLKDTPRVLYRLAEIAAAPAGAVVFVVEGEKDADNVAALGQLATTSPQGAGKWDKLADDSALDGKRVVIVPDKDDPGRKHAAQVAQALHGRAAEVRILELPGSGKDVSDWIDAQDAHTPEEIAAALLHLAEAAPIYAPPATAATAEETPPAEAKDKRTLREIAKGTTDVANAARFVLSKGKDFLYCGAHGGIMVWDGRRWACDTTLKAVAAAKEVALDILDEAKKAKGDNERERLAKHAVISQRQERLGAMVNLARPELAVAAEDLDADDWLLNLYNGTVDLRTGELREHRREDRLTMQARTTFDNGAECPLWEATLTRIMSGNAGMIQFLQRVFGMCLTGDVREQNLFIFHGQGSNGKSVVLDTVSSLLGDYSAEAAPDLLIHRANSEHATEYADLCGRRLVIASESEEGGRMRVELVKRLTGNTTIKGRFMREDFFSFKRTHKLVLATNNRPRVPESSHAIWRRIKLIPFNVTIPDADQDKDLLAKLKAEWPGILQWIIAGCLAWQKEGLRIPESVTKASNEYREDEDTLTEFIEAKCIVSASANVSKADLFDAYTAWIAEIKDRFPMSRRALYERLLKHAEVKPSEWWNGHGKTRGFSGIGLAAQGDTPREESWQK